MLLRQESQRHGQRQRRSAFTLMEMLVVVAIIVALAGIGGFFLLQQLKDSQKDIASTQVKGPLTNACQAYSIKHGGQFPGSLQQLRQKDQTGGPWLESDDALIDPWGQPYQYEAAGGKNGGTRPDIWTTVPNTNEPVGNWPKQQAH